jgi:hypothetical protein
MLARVCASVGNIDAFAFVPESYAVDLQNLENALENDELMLCAGRSDGWLIAKRPGDLFAPNCEQLFVPLDMRSCFRIDSVSKFSSQPSIKLLSRDGSALDHNTIDAKYRYLIVWPSARSCPVGYMPVQLGLYVVQRQKYIWPNVEVIPTAAPSVELAVARCSDFGDDGDVVSDVDDAVYDDNNDNAESEDDSVDQEIIQWTAFVVSGGAVERALRDCCRAGDVDRLLALCAHHPEQISSKLVDILLLEFADAITNDTKCSVLRRSCAAVIPILVELGRTRDICALAVLGVDDVVKFDESLFTDTISNNRNDLALALLEFRNAPHSADGVRRVS